MNKKNLLGLSGVLVAVTGGVLWTTLNSNAQEAPKTPAAKTPAIKAPAAKAPTKAMKAMKGEVQVVEYPLGENGLYFAGKRGIDYAFGPRITPHGDCVTAIPGYVFTSWYKGPRSDRHLTVSRLNLATGTWKHVELPERNTTGHQNRCPENPDGCGESHRTAAVEVSPLDGTIHLMFDMHANDLQYIVSKPGVATLPDDEFNASQFNPKQDGFERGQKLEERITYPGFKRNEKGEVFAQWRQGGSGNGNMVSASYGEKGWSKSYITWFGQYSPKPKDDLRNVSIYGDEKYLSGKMYSGFSVRIPTNDIEVNQGVYFAEGGQRPSDPWTDLKGNKHPIPIKDYTPFKIDEPVPNNDYRMSSGPSWTVSPRGDVHMIVDFSTKKPAIHYYRPAGAKAFIKSVNADAPGGALYAAGDNIISFGQSKGQLTIATTPAGKDEWKKVPVAKTPKIAFGNSILQDGVLYYFAMEDVGNPQSQPLTLLAIDLKKIG